MVASFDQGDVNSEFIANENGSSNVVHTNNIDDVAYLFGVPLKSCKDIDDFTKDLELGNSEGTPIVDEALVAKPSIPTTSLPSHESPIAKNVDVNTKSTSYAGAAGASTKDQPKVISNFRPLVADPVFDGVNISIPQKVVKKVSTHFEHTLYGYFFGKRLAFLVIAYYAWNKWAKHGLKRIMIDTKGYFFFKFDTRASLEAVLEGGPWMILNAPIILKKWSMDTKLLKEELTSIILIWVKLHDVPLQVFEEDGISLIATFIAKSVMLDLYISSMCNDSWGRSDFARCLIKVNSEADLVDVVTIGIPSFTGMISSKKPSVLSMNGGRPCVICTVGKKKKRKGKLNSTNGGKFDGPSVKQSLRYEPKASISAPKKGASNISNASNLSSLLKTVGASPKNDNIPTSNSYSALNDEEEDEE
ncbi:zinc knuckle CX2CX4HX4C containing protein [Tanacetum coccineum]